jgi:hypothetical protein
MIKSSNGKDKVVGDMDGSSSSELYQYFAIDKQLNNVGLNESLNASELRKG